MDAGRHPRIKLYAYSEVEQVAGFVGNFNVTIRKKARYVDETECTACQECTEVCPVIVPDEYQEGFSSRKAIYIPFPQSVPSSYILDVENCLGMNPIACGKCADACEKKCINYDDIDKTTELEVGTVIVATGMEPYDPTTMDEYGYTRFENVITSMEFERLICAGGPVEGHFIRPTDRKTPKNVAFIQCVGSRSLDGRGSPYCSNICCMNTVKDTLLLADHYPDIQSKVFYIDIRAFGKGFEDLYIRSKEAGVQYIRGIPGDVWEDPETHGLKLAEDTTDGKVKIHDADLVVLSVGVEPREDLKKLQQQLTLSNSADGFLLESHPKLKPVDAPTRGVFFAGFCESPKDIKDSVCQAGASASRAGALLNAGQITVEAITSIIDAEACTKCGLCAGVCPYGAINWQKGDIATVVEAACSGCGACGAQCQFGAITMRHFTDDQLIAQVRAVLRRQTPR